MTIKNEHLAFTLPQRSVPTISWDSFKTAFFGAPAARAAVVTWDGGGATNNWNDCDNWSGNTCPTTADVATFDGTSTKNATINTNISVAGIDINTGYTGTITQAATVTIPHNLTGFDQADGTFTGGAFNMTVASPFVQSGGIFTAPSATLAWGGSAEAGAPITISGGTFNHNSGTVLFQGRGVSHGGGTIDINSSLTLNHVSLSAVASVKEFAGGDTYVVLGNLTLDATTTLRSSNTTAVVFDVRGNIDQTSTFVGLATPVRPLEIQLNGTGTQTYTVHGGKTLAIRMTSNADASVVFDTGINATLGGNLTMSTGTFTATSGTLFSSNALGTQVAIFDVSGGTFNHNNGTIHMHGRGWETEGGRDEFPQSITVNNLILENVSQGDFDITTGKTVTVEGNLTLTDGTVHTGTLAVQGNVTVASTYDGGTSPLQITGTNNQTYTDNGGNELDGDVTINKTSGTVSLASNADWNATNQDVTITEGTLAQAGFTLATNVLTVEDGGTLQLQGAETLTATTKTLNTGSTIRFVGDGDSASDTYTITNHFTNYKHLTINSTDGATDTFQLGAALDVDQNLTITAGTLDVTTSNYAINVGGNWSNSGSFNARSGTVTFDGTNQTISGTNTFYNLTKTESTNDATNSTWTFPAGETTTVSNTWTVDGLDSDDKIALASSSGGTQWNIDPEGTRTIDNATVTDSNNTSGTLINEYSDSTVTSGGNNTGWAFSTDSAFTWLGTTSTWSTGSNWLGGVAPGSGNVAVFDGAKSNADATISSNVSIAGMSIESDYNGTITQASGNTIAVGSSAGDLGWAQSGGTFTGSDSAISIGIGHGINFNLSGGTFTSTTGTLSWANTEVNISGGTFNHNNGTVAFTGSDAKTINVPTSLTLYNFTINKGSRTTIASGDTIIVSNTLLLTDGVLYGPGIIDARGDVTQASTFDGGTSGASGVSTIRLGGSTTQTFTVNGGGMAGLNIANANASVVFADDVNVGIFGPFTMSAGTFTSTSGTLSWGGDNNDTSNLHITISGGTFNHNNGTIRFRGTNSTINVNSSLTLNNVEFNKVFNTSVQTIASGDTLIIGGTFTFANGLVNTGTLQAQGDVTVASTYDGGSALLHFTGTNNQTYTDNGGNELDGDITINKSSGTVTLASNADWNATNQDVTITEGTLALSGNTLATNTLTVDDGGTLQLRGAETLTATTKTLNTGSTVRFVGDGDSASDTYTVTNYFTNYKHLTINSTDGATDTFQLGAALDVDQNLTVTAGTLDVTASNYAITVGGDWSNSGTFNEQAGTVTFDGSGSSNTISEPGSFYNLAFSGSGVWDAQTDVTATNNLSLSSGTLDLAGNDLVVGGTFTTGGTLRLNGLEASVATPTNLTSAGTIAYDNSTALSSLLFGTNYYNLTLQGTETISLPGALDVNNNLTVNSGATLDTNGFDITVGGNLTNSGTIANTANRTFTLDGTTQTFTSGGITLGTLTLSGSSGTVSLGSSVTLGELLSIAAGRVLSLVSFTLDSNGAITNSGTINEGSGKIQHDSSDFYIADSNFDEDAAISLGVDRVYLTVVDEDGNLNGSSADTISNAVTVSCPTDNETVSLTETGSATEVFRYTTGIVTGVYDGSASNNDGTLECSDGATITAVYTDPQDNGDTQSDTSSATSDTIPSAPSGLSGTADSSSAITWTWTDNSNNETGFKLYNAANDVLIATIATAGATSYQETGLSAATSYSRYVVAYNNAGNSSASNTANAMTEAGIPAAPSGFTGEAISPTSIEWTWTDNASNETGFKLLDSSNNVIVTIASANSTSYTETDLTPGTSYTRKVVAYAGAGNSSASNSATVTTEESTAPNAFSLLSPVSNVFLATGTPSFAWNKATDDEDDITNYTLTLTLPAGTNLVFVVPKDGDSANNPSAKTHEGDRFTAQYFNENDGNPSNDIISVALKAGSINELPLREGKHAWNVTATDEGNNERTSASRTFTVDTTRPNVISVHGVGAIVNETPTVTINSTDNYALGELAVTLQKAKVVLGVTTSYETIEAKTFALSSTSAATAYAPGVSLEAGGKYKLLLTLSDSAGNTREASYDIQVLTAEQQAEIAKQEEREAAEEAIAQLDPDSTPAEEILETLREFLPEQPLAIPDLQRQALVRRQKQAQIFDQLFTSVGEQMLASLVRSEGYVKEITFWVLNSAHDANERAIALLQWLENGLTEGRSRLAQAFFSSMYRVQNGIAGVVRSTTSGAAAIARNTAHLLEVQSARLAVLSEDVSSTFLTAAIQAVSVALDTMGDGLRSAGTGIARVNRAIPTYSTDNLKTARQQAQRQWQDTGMAVLARLTGTLQAGRDTRVRVGLRNRQLINRYLEQGIASVVGQTERIALKVRATYELWLDSEPTRITNVRITSLTSTSAVVEWQTNHLTRTTKVNYGPTTSYGQEAVSHGLSDTHRVELTNLEPNTTYYFEVMNQNGGYVFDAYYTLTTPAENQEVREGVFVPQDVVTKGRIAVRRQPTPEADVILTTEPGQRFRGLTGQDGWISVLLPSGQEGWVVRDEIELVASTQPSGESRQ